MSMADVLFYLAVLLGLSTVATCSPVQTTLEKAAAVAAGVTGSEVDLDTPANRLYQDAVRVVDTMKEFLTALSDFEEIQVGEAQREDEIRQHGVKRGKSGGFRVNGWKRKRRSLMESDILAAAFTNKLDHKAADMVRKIYTFLDDLQSVSISIIYLGKNGEKIYHNHFAKMLRGKTCQRLLKV